MLITSGGVLIRTRVNEIREMGRSTQGVTLINLGEGEKLSGLQCILGPRRRKWRKRRNGTDGGTHGTNGRERRRGRHTAPEGDTADGEPTTGIKPAARIFNFGAGPADDAGRGAREGQVGAGQLARGRHVRDGDEPSRQGVRRDRRRGRGGPAQARSPFPPSYKVLFLQGGATMQFSGVPMNLLRGARQRRLREHRRMVEEGHRRRRRSSAR